MRRCHFCGQKAVHPRQICDRAGCRGLLAGRLRTDRQERRERRTALEVLLREREAELRALHGAAIPETVVRATVPSYERPTGPLPDERRADFLAHLSRVIEEGIEFTGEPSLESPKAPESQAALIGGACATCRGWCCRNGGTRAYLSWIHFRRYLQRHPGKSKEEIVAEYRERIPTVTHRDSCVFHTETGCALPREMRADICNSFLCDGVRSMLSAQPEGSPPLPVLSFSLRNDDELVRTTLFDGRSPTVHELA